jgi:hypothetical protein
MPSEGTITSLPVHALFACCRCGALCERLTRAKVTCGGIGAAERPPGEVVCNGCTAKEQTENDAKRDAAYARKAWARRAKTLTRKG